MSTSAHKGDPYFSRIQLWLFLMSIICALISVGWAAGDYLYRGDFHTPGLWWVLLLIGLFTLAAFCVTHGQAHLSDQLHGLRHDIIDYGDQRETDGHTFARQIHNGKAARLHTVD